MSTKATIEYNDNFHFYNECFIDDRVYLDLEYDILDFEVRPDKITVGIQAEDMDKIAKASLP